MNTPHTDNSDALQLLQSTSRSLMVTIGVLYLAWHIIATLTWPQIFSPSLWLVSLGMLGLLNLSLYLVSRRYLLAQATWLGGLTLLILLAYALYQRAEVLLLLATLPLVSIVTVGGPAALVLQAAQIGLLLVLPAISDFPPVPEGYLPAIVLGGLFTVVFGWSLSNNLLEALGSASYHYSEARRLLEETRQHRSELSQALKDRNQAFYQLERMNQMLEFARSQAEEARAERDRFVLAVSHELRSPLNLIIGFSDLMVNSPETYLPLEDWPAGLHDDIVDVYRSSTHLMGLINDILDMGQMDARQMALFRERTNLADIAQDVFDLLRPAFAQKGLWLRGEIEPNLPEVFADRIRLRQVMLNLVNNSLRFTEQGGVTLGLRCEADQVVGWVRDTGVGIAPEDADKVFDEFRQVGQDAWRRRKGSGLGLAIGKRFVALHGGKMWLESQVGTGTCFYFSIPLVSVGQESELLPSAEAGKLPVSGPEKLLLLLCRTPGAASRLQKHLDEYTIQQVEDPDLLPASVARWLPQAVLVDADSSPGPLQGLPYDLPVLRMHFASLGGEQSLPPGVVDYLVKPVLGPQLAQAVQKAAPQAQQILCVDDDPAMLRFIALALQARPSGTGCILDGVTSGGEALRKLNDQPYDLVLLDIDLPDMNGWDVLRHIQHGQPAARPAVIILSALDLPHMLSLGSYEVLTITRSQPPAAAELARLMRQTLDALPPAYPKPAGAAAPLPPIDSSA